MADQIPKDDSQSLPKVNDVTVGSPPAKMVEYKGTQVPYQLYEHLAAVENFQADPRDVCISSFPKTGTTFITAVVHMILNDGEATSLTDGETLDEKVLFLEATSPSIKDGERGIHRLVAAHPPRTYYTYLNLQAMPKSIHENGANIVYVARNPKDCIISTYHMLKAFPLAGFNGSVEDMAQTFIDNQCAFAPFYDHIALALTYQRTHTNLFFTTFETMLKDLRSVVKDLGIFLGKNLTEEQLDSITHHCGFDSMKNNDNANKSILHKTGLLDFTVSPFIRTGKVGTWKKHFSSDLDERVNQWIATEEKRVEDSLQGFKFEYE